MKSDGPRGGPASTAAAGERHGAQPVPRCDLMHRVRRIGRLRSDGGLLALAVFSEEELGDSVTWRQTVPAGAGGAEREGPTAVTAALAGLVPPQPRRPRGVAQFSETLRLARDRRRGGSEVRRRSWLGTIYGVRRTGSGHSSGPRVMSSEYPRLPYSVCCRDNTEWSGRGKGHDC